MDYKKYQTQSAGSKYTYLPTINNESTFKVEKIIEVRDGDKKYHYIKHDYVTLEDGTQGTVAKNLGFHHQVILNDGRILSINNLSAFRKVFMQNNVQEGDTIKVKHLDKGKWEVTKEENVIDV